MNNQWLAVVQKMPLSWQHEPQATLTVLVLSTSEGASTRPASLVHDTVCDVDVFAVTVNSASQLYPAAHVVSNTTALPADQARRHVNAMGLVMYPR